MRKLILSLAIIVIFFACQEQESIAPASPDDSVVELQNVKSQRGIPDTDPNMNANFNWETANGKWLVYYDIGGGVQSTSPVIPFHDDDIFGFADDADRDYKASQGWMLVARDFGTPNDAPTNPWIMFYNKYRGLLRLCVLRTSSQTTQHQSTIVTLDNSTATPDLFEFVGTTSQTAITQEGHMGWMVSEYNFQGYDASITQQARLLIDIHEVSSYDIYLNGQLQLNGQAQPKPKFINGVHEVSNYSSKVWETIGILGSEDFEFKLSSVAKNIFSITGAAAGIIKGLTGSGTASTYNINLEGDVSLSGSMTQTHPPVEFTVYLRHDANRGAQPRALQSIPWGVMNYSSAVVLTSELIIPEGEEENDENLIQRTTSSPGFFNNKLIINPSIAGSISTTEAGWVINEQDNVNFMPLTMFQNSSYLHEAAVGTPAESHIPKAVAIRITFNNGDVVYNRIPVQINSI